MSFQTDIVTILNADSSLNKMISKGKPFSPVTGGIYFEIYPVNADLNKNWLLFNYRENERTNVLGSKNVLTYYSFYIKVISRDQVDLLQISDEANRYLSNYQDNHVLNIDYVADDHQNGETEDARDIFQNIIEYRIAYI